MIPLFKIAALSVALTVNIPTHDVSPGPSASDGGARSRLWLDGLSPEPGRRPGPLVAAMTPRDADQAIGGLTAPK